MTIGWLISILGGAIAALLSCIIAISALTGVDAGHEDPGTNPGSGQYADE